MKMVMVAGASGVLGRLVCEELLRIFGNQMKLVVADYQEDRGKQTASSLGEDVGFRYLNVKNENSIKMAIDCLDVVIVTTKQIDPLIQSTCIKKNILCLDVTPFQNFVAKVQNLDDDAKENGVLSIVMSGFLPGLSGLMVKEAVSVFHKINNINIGLMQNTNAKAGITGMLDMLKIISQEVTYIDDKKSHQLPGFSKKENMYFYEHKKVKKVRLIDHTEKRMLEQYLNTDRINYYTSWNNPFLSKLISSLKRIGVLRIIDKLDRDLLGKLVKHNPDKREEAFLTVEVRGVINNKECRRVMAFSTFSDYHTTAMVTAALVKFALREKFSGVVFPTDITSFEEVISEIDCDRMKFKSFIVDD
ncbi:saccharopine dehydrogenase NADP-binding domain-containing protein [Aquibacillus rhizosphaerae]|uniref:Saccharopine dehydrogenase NADP-binding domain-containing protein n=1 Tax=Aquibacillus rhizosphaerae TaxID=3051431 RepID=A0ABT7L8D2_9BACI|nr:saccharopine dehydrogenase NADP-binding domain-containing protein [Aquibacillus sp. LR5S19]MDL4840850.1 saccharopine dehydrogenase NADP-binding domain-containing protein [Aquibacillus sp. LR5S19]